MSGKAKLKVVYHEDHSTDVLHARGEPVVCKDCRFSGWLTLHDFRENKVPTHCLLYSGGADPHDGNRVILDDVEKDRYYYSGQRLLTIRSYDAGYPKCMARNQSGQCKDFLRAKKQSLFERIFRRKAMRR
jgi:hypothetical protein